MTRVLNWILLVYASAIASLAAAAPDLGSMADRVPAIRSHHRFDQSECVLQFEFFVWHQEEDLVATYIVCVKGSAARAQGAQLEVIRLDGSTTTVLLNEQRTQYLLSELKKSELFDLPIEATAGRLERSTFGGTSVELFLGIRSDGTTERQVFRWLGESYPVDKVMEVLERLARQ